MVKSLTDKLREKARKAGKSIRNYALLGTAIASIGLASCRFPGPDPIPPTPPTPPTLDYVDISGILQDNESDGAIPRQGTIKIYNPVDNSLLKTVQTDASGNFCITLDQLVSELPSGEILQAAMTDSSGNTLQSYVRTIMLPAGDQKPITVPTGNPAVRVVPYPNFDTNNDGIINLTDYANFKQHIYLTNSIGTGLEKFDLDNLYKGGIEIMIENHNGNSSGSFSPPVQSLIKNKILNDAGKWFNGTNDGINLYVKGKIVQILIDDLSSNGLHYSNLNNWIVIEPYNSGTLGLDVVGHTNINLINNDPTLANGALIQLVSDINGNPFDYTINHETGHASNASPGESYYSTSIMPPGYQDPSYIDPIVSSDGTWNGLTIMQTGINFPTSSVTIGNGDLKQRSITNQDTYQRAENIDNIMGMSFSSP